MRIHPPRECGDVYISPFDKDKAILTLARQWAEMSSKDPNTAVGAVVYHPPTHAMFMGYNGFPQSVPDYRKHWDCREHGNPMSKYYRVAHAETNAIRRAHAVMGEDLSMCTLYVTAPPCVECMRAHIRPSLIKTVVFTGGPVSSIVVDIAAEARVSLKEVAGV